MRHQGRITRWHDDKGFGFLKQHGDETAVFVHIKAFAKGSPRPAENDVVTYELGKDARGRPRAEKVAFPRKAHLADTAQAEPGLFGVFFTVLFLGFLYYAVFSRHVSPYIPFMYAAASLLAFIVYAWDKSFARNNEWRTSESTLLFFGLACGWPGAFLAQRLLRHKTKKKNFQDAFWVTVIVNVLGLILFATDIGPVVLRRLAGVS